MASIEGQINIDVTLNNALAADINVSSSRPVQLYKLFVGKTPEQALTTIPLLFNICDVAQSRAALSAIQQKMSIKQHHSAAIEAARDILVYAENAKEHLLRILLDWPVLFDCKSDNQDLPYCSQLVKDFKQTLFQNGQAFTLKSESSEDLSAIENLIDQLEDYLTEHVFYMPLQQWLALEGTMDLQHWAEQHTGVVAESIATIFRQGWEKQGASQSAHLPRLDDDELLTCLNADDVDVFTAEPVWKGVNYETTPLSRQIEQPLVQHLVNEFGAGLIARWVARLVELARIPMKMRGKVSHLATKIVPFKQKKTAGISYVEAARGRLIHRVDIEQGIINQYQIIAPTEWSFHSSGLIFSSLSNIKTGDKDEWQQLARLLINAIDPCVGYQLRVQ